MKKIIFKIKNPKILIKENVQQFLFRGILTSFSYNYIHNYQISVMLCLIYNIKKIYYSHSKIIVAHPPHSSSNE